MNRCMRKHVVLAMAIAAAAAGVRAEDTDASARLEHLQRERDAIDARYRQQQAECAGRFTVTACIDDAKAKRRQALEPLDRERAALEEQTRRRRAAERLQRIEDKRREAAQRQPPPLETRKSSVIGALPDAPPRAGRPTPARPPAQPRLPRAGASQAYEKRQQEAEEHRAAVNKRNEARQRPPAAPLPAPSSP